MSSTDEHLSGGSEQPHSTSDGPMSDDATSPFPTEFGAAPGSVRTLSHSKRQASRTLSGTLRGEEQLSPLAVQVLATKHAHLSPDAAATGDSPVNTQLGTPVETHVLRSGGALLTTPEAASEHGSTAAGDALSHLLERQMSLGQPGVMAQEALVSPTPAEAPAAPSAKQPTPPPGPTPPAHKHGTRRAAASAASSSSSSDAGLASGHGALSNPSSRTGFVYDARMTEHTPPPNTLHPERPGRLHAIHKRLQAEGLLAACRSLTPHVATDNELLTVHTADHVDRISNFTSLVEARGDPDLYGSEGTPLAARLAAGCVTQAARAVMDGTVQTAFALVRPPGHHAACARCSGFCLFNNVAVAARAVQMEGAGRVAILDWDVHHGDGTQAIFEEDPSVLYMSLHRFGNGFFPCTGAAKDVGTGPGTGFSVNVPWEEIGLTAADYMAALRFVILPILTDFAPDVLFISAGYDALQGDPLGGMCLTPPTYAAMTTALLTALPPHRRAVIALEGGYNEDAIAAAAEATMKAALRFGGATSTVAAPPALRKGKTHRKTTETLRAVRAVQSPHWPCLAETDAQFEAFCAEEEAKLGGHALPVADCVPAEQHAPATPAQPRSSPGGGVAVAPSASAEKAAHHVTSPHSAPVQPKTPVTGAANEG